MTNVTSARKQRRDWRPTFLEAFAKHGEVKAACAAAKISRQTAYRTRHADEDFALAWHDIEEAVVDELETTLVECARGTAWEMENPSAQVRALYLVLSARRPQRYRENVHVEHTGTVTLADLVSLVERDETQA